jgi:hypothetical protein
MTKAVAGKVAPIEGLRTGRQPNPSALPGRCVRKSGWPDAAERPQDNPALATNLPRMGLCDGPSTDLFAHKLGFRPTASSEKWGEDFSCLKGHQNDR